MTDGLKSSLIKINVDFFRRSISELIALLVTENQRPLLMIDTCRSVKFREGAQLCTLNVSSLRDVKELDSSKDMIIHEPSSKTIHKFQFAVHIELFQGNTFFSRQRPIVGSFTQHTHIRIC